MERPHSQLESASFAYQSARSLLQNIPDRTGVLFRPIYEENALSPEMLPLNVEEEMLPSFMRIVAERNIQPGLSHYTYWNPNMRYDPIEVFGAMIQSVDLHDAPLPRTVLPPEENVAKFIDTIKDATRKVTISEQFELALDITDNDLLGAANLAWIATRFMARGADQRAYPGIFMDEIEVRNWNGKLAQFETYNNSGKNDGPGDNYYFWTHLFGAMAFTDRGVQAKIGQLAFSRGTQIMAFVRKHIARKQPNITAHQPASVLGRELGLALANLDQADFQSLTQFSANSMSVVANALPASVEYGGSAIALSVNEAPTTSRESL